VYFHFSGHSAHVPDPEGVHGYIETIIPSDYDLKAPNYNGIADRELFRLVQQLSDKHPAIVMLTFDAGFGSAPITRGLVEPTRGFVAPDQSADSSFSKSDQEASGARLARPNVVAITACRQGQSAHEWHHGGYEMGLFTYALTQALQSATDTTTYRDLLDTIMATMAREGTGNGGEQSPQIDGALDNVILSGIALPKQKSIDITVVDKGLELNAGALQSVSAGSKFKIYPNDTKEFQHTKEIATATVVGVDLLTSNLRLDNGEENLKTLQEHDHLKAIEVLHSYDNEGLLSVGLDGFEEPLRQRLLDALGQCPGVHIATRSQSPDVKVSYSSKLILVARNDGTQLLKVGVPSGSADSDLLTKLKTSLQKEMTWRFLRMLSNSAPDSSVGISAAVIPVDIEVRDKDGQPVQIIDKRIPDGLLQLSDGDYFQVQVKNTGSSLAFITVLDLEPDGKIAPIYPSRDTNYDHMLPPDKQWHRIPQVFQVGPPFGNDMIKVVATSSPADFSPLITDEEGTGRGASRSPNNPIFNFIQQRFAAGGSESSSSTKKASPKGLFVDEWATATCVMQTYPRPKQANNSEDH
jgi:hypothetical protein